MSKIHYVGEDSPGMISVEIPAIPFGSEVIGGVVYSLHPAYFYGPMGSESLGYALVRWGQDGRLDGVVEIYDDGDPHPGSGTRGSIVYTVEVVDDVFPRGNADPTAFFEELRVSGVV